MKIELRCEKCGHRIRAPREAAGKQAKCPNCQSDVYIPTPEEEIEELPLAPEDSAEREREEQLQAERRRLEHALAHEDDAPTETHPSLARPSKGPVPPGRTTVKGVVLTYLAAMRDSDLERAEEALRLLATHKAKAMEMIDQLVTDQIPPAEMANVPPGVYQGFLKSLRSKL